MRCCAGQTSTNSPIARGRKLQPGLEMREQTLRLVLGENGHPANPGVQAVRQGEVDIAEVPAKGNRWLALPSRELAKSSAVATGENERQGITQKISHRPTVVIVC